MDVLNHRDLPFSIPSVCVDPWPRDETTHMSCINQMQGNAYNKSDQLRRCFVIDLQTRYGWSNITESMAELWLTGVNNTVSKSTLLLEFEGTITFRFNCAFYQLVKYCQCCSVHQNRNAPTSMHYTNNHKKKEKPEIRLM